MDPDTLRAELPAFANGRAPDALGEWLKLYRFEPVIALCHHWRAGRIATPGGEVVGYLFEPARPRATALLVHGYYDHTGLYRHVIQALLESGCVVVALDLPGHGLSGGPRASIDDFRRYVEAVQALLQALPAQLPERRCAVGQSTGGAVLMDYLLAEPAPWFSRACLLAPLVRPAQWHRSRLRYAVGRWLYTEVERDYVENSHDPEFLDFVRSGDPLQSRSLPVPWVGAMIDWVARFRRARPRPEFPLLVVQGDEDGTVDWRHNLPAIRRKFPRAELVHIPGGRHHLANESEALRRQVFAHMLRFLDADERGGGASPG